MADISKITILSGTYDIKDQTARDSIEDLEEQIGNIGDKYIVFIGDSWTTEYPEGTNMWYLKVATRLGLTPKVYGDGGSGFIHIGAHGTFMNQVNNAINDIEDPQNVKIVAVTGGINDYHDSSINPGSVLRTAVENVMIAITENFPNAEIVFTPLQMSYEQMTPRAFEFLNDFKAASLQSNVTVLCGAYNWIKTFPQNYAYYDTHMNQAGNNIFASSWLSTYHGLGYNHTHLYQNYPMNGVTVLNADARVVGSKVSIYAQLQVDVDTVLNGNVNIINFDNNVVGLPLYNISARAVTCWVNLQTSSGSRFKSIPAYLTVTSYPGTSNNQGELKITCHFDESLTISSSSSYVYITCDIDTALTM